MPGSGVGVACGSSGSGAGPGGRFTVAPEGRAGGAGAGVPLAPLTVTVAPVVHALPRHAVSLYVPAAAVFGTVSLPRTVADLRALSALTFRLPSRLSLARETVTVCAFALRWPVFLTVTVAVNAPPGAQ